MEQGYYKPMLVTELKSLPKGNEWVYEPKLDGYRMLAYQSLLRTRLMTRSGRSVADEFPAVAQQLPDAVGGHAAVLDGEMVGFNEQGLHSVSSVKRRGARVMYYAFDLLELDGEQLIYKPWEDRRNLLEEVFEPQENVQLCEYFEDRDALLKAVLKMELEGIVAKRRQSIYQPGRRSQDWQKLRVKRVLG